MKTITMYELLGLVKDGKVPKKIKYADYEYSWHGEEHKYCRSVILSNWIALTTDFSLLEILNTKVEILEDTMEDRYREMEEVRNYKPNPSYLTPKEEKKIPEKLGMTYMKKIDDDAFITERFSQAEQQIVNTVNALIDYLKSKGDE